MILTLSTKITFILQLSVIIPYLCEIDGFTRIPDSMFASCTLITEANLNRDAAVVSLNTTLNSRAGNPVPTIYVPAALVESYKTTAPWSNYAEHIRPLDEI